MNEKISGIHPLRIRIEGRKWESFLSGAISYSKPHHAYIPLVKPSGMKKVGSLIIDFVEAEMMNKDGFLAFVNMWGIGGFEAYSPLLREQYAFYKSKMTFYNENEYQELMSNIWQECNSALSTVQSKVRSLVYNCLDIEGPEWANNLSPIQRYYIYSRNSENVDWIGKLEYRTINKVNFSEDTNAMQIVAASKISSDSDFNSFIQKVKNTHFEMIEEYESTDIASMIYLEFKEMLYQNTTMGKCKNCHKYFLPENRSDEEYCSRIVESTNKTCKEIGPKKHYSDKYKSNPLKKEYLTRYRTIHARTTAKGKKKITYGEFVSWNERAKQMLEEYMLKYENAISEEQMEKLLLDFKEYLKS